MEGTDSRGADRNTDGKRRLRRTSTMAVVLTSAALVAGACSSSDQPKKTVASVNASAASAAPKAAAKADMLAYAKCMRENGVPSFPDPKPGQGLAFKPGGALDPTSAEFKKAQSHCAQFMGSGPVQSNPAAGWSSADKLKYAQCMRASGVPKFPDPDANGGFPPLIKGGAVDPESPQFKKATDACKKYQPQNMQKTGPQKIGPGSGS